MSSPVNLDASSPWARLRAAFDHLWPARCLVCGERAGNDDLCPACVRELPWNRCACPRCALPLPPLPIGASAPACGHCQRRPPPLADTRAVFRYAPPLDRLLPRLKFHRDLAAGRACALHMALALAEAPRPDALVPLPLHPARLRERGFDQTLELARPLARTLDLPLLDRALLRVRDTAPQSRLDAPARRRNLRRAFAIRPGVSLPAHVALVDDVMTTGATLHAAAETLLRAGVTRVDAWVCARVA